MQVRSALRCNISNTRKSVFTGYQVGRKNEAQPSFFNRLRGVWIPDETLFKCLIQLLRPLKILGEIQSKSSQNFMLNEAMYPNHRHGSHFLLFFSL